MNRKNIWLLLGIIVVIAVMLSVYNRGNVDSRSIRIGAVLHLTGPAGTAGELLKTGLQWKINELKESGRKIDFTIEDGQSDPKQAVSAFNKLTDIDNYKIIFTVSSAAGMNLKPIAEEKNVLLWGDITHPDFTASSSYILRHSNIVDSDTRIIADEIISKKLKKVAVLYQQDEFGKVFNDYLTRYLSDSDIQVISEGVDQKSSDFRTSIFKIKAVKPDAIVVAVFGPGAGIVIKQVKELGYDGLIYESVGFILTPAAQEIAGDLAKGVYYQTYIENNQFDTAYMEKFGKAPPLLAVIGYTDIELLIDAIDKTGSSDPEKIITYIKSMGSFQGRFEKVNITPQGDIVIPTIIKVWE